MLELILGKYEADQAMENDRPLGGSDKPEVTFTSASDPLLGKLGKLIAPKLTLVETGFN
jgi:hypothetical protein